MLVVVWRFAWPAMLDAGTGLRARHRWAVIEAAVDGRQRLLLWAPVPPLAPESPLAGAPEGVHVRTDGQRTTTLRLRLGGGPLPAGRYGVHFRLESAASLASLTLAGKTLEVSAGAPAAFDAEVDHPGGPLTLSATAAGPAPGSLWVSEAKLETLR